MKESVVLHQNLVDKAIASIPKGEVTEERAVEAAKALAVYGIGLRFHRELTPTEVDNVADAAYKEFGILEQIALAKPHVVHVKDQTELGEVYHWDCPDCTRGLNAGICMQLPRTDLAPCHSQCIVACGRPR